MKRFWQKENVITLDSSYYMTNAVKADVQKDTAESLDEWSAPNSIAKSIM